MLLAPVTAEIREIIPYLAFPVLEVIVSRRDQTAEALGLRKAIAIHQIEAYGPEDHQEVILASRIVLYQTLELQCAQDLMEAETEPERTRHRKSLAAIGRTLAGLTRDRVQLRSERARAERDAGKQAAGDQTVQDRATRDETSGDHAVHNQAANGPAAGERDPDGDATTVARPIGRTDPSAPPAAQTGQSPGPGPAGNGHRTGPGFGPDDAAPTAASAGLPNLAPHSTPGQNPRDPAMTAANAARFGPAPNGPDNVRR